MSRRLLTWSLTSALAGFLFGFDTVVISGAEQKIQNLWGLNSFMHGLALSAALWGTVIGSLSGGWPTDFFGRKKTLLSIGILYLVSAIWSALANDVYSFMIARLTGGLGIGISTVAAPLYISEISPPGRRGLLAGLFQFNIVFGILIAFVSNYVLGSYLNENAWRWMLGIEAVPAIIYTALCFGIPCSPRWLVVKKGDTEKAKQVLQLINANAATSEIDSLVEEIKKSAEEKQLASAPFFSARLRVPILLAFLVAFFNQLSGINAILYFAPRIFQLAGLRENAALLNSIGIGVTNLIFTFLGLYLIDRLGRRSLLYIGSFGYIVSLGLCSLVFFSYGPEFRVANAAINLKTSVAKLLEAESLVVQNETDIENLKNRLESAIDEFGVATSSSGNIGAELDDPSFENINVAVDSALKEVSAQSGSAGMIVLVCIFAFIAAHAVGQGTVIWVLISEIFPNKHRASGQALGSFTHWFFAALLTFVFPWMISTFAPGYVFGFFCFMMILHLLWVVVMVPETKGVKLEEMQTKLGITGG